MDEKWSLTSQTGRDQKGWADEALQPYLLLFFKLLVYAALGLHFFFIAA